MYQMNARSAVQSYQNVHTQTGVMDASPHKLISMLLNGGLERLAQAKGAIAQDNAEQKNELINKSIGIIGGLQDALDMEKGGEIALNLYRLYDFMIVRLFEANRTADAEIINEVARLLIDVKTGWDGIAPKFEL